MNVARSNFLFIVERAPAGAFLRPAGKKQQRNVLLSIDHISFNI
jgi:hypothetical protein